MQLTRCPVCHSRIHLDALIQDDAGRELLGLIVRSPDHLSSALVMYLGLFRPATRDLVNNRALRLANEVLGLCTDQHRLTLALTETVQSFRIKQDQGSFKPLSNHRYLERVLENVSVSPSATVIQQGNLAPVKPQSKAAQVIDMLKAYSTPEDIPEWFTRTVCGTLAEMMIIGLDNVPPADTMSLVAERMLKELWPKRQWERDCRSFGAKRLRIAFIQAAEHSKRWPSPKDVLECLPRV